MKKHQITIDRPISVIDHGLLLGNGDISVSFYQQPGLLIWRFGKGDVWDRRVDYHLDPKPAHIRELANGIEKERWCCGPYGGKVEALNGTANPERMQNICQGTPSRQERPYPCPKPVGELMLHYPADLPNMEIKQTLIIEDALLKVTCSWSNGVSLDLQAFIAPNNNVLVIDWKLGGWNYDTAVGEMYLPPLWFALYRHADLPSRNFGEEYRLRYNPIFKGFSDSEITPMEKPFLTKIDNGIFCIQQNFSPEATFPQGFRYGMLPVSQDLQIKPIDDVQTMAALRLLPLPENNAGTLYVAVESAGSDEELHEKLKQNLFLDTSELLDSNLKESRRFWDKSSVSLDDKLVENLWYENLYARRCAYRKGKLPPGLYFPSTVLDYSLWHGDFHMNYNFQQPFLGDYGANHFEIADSYFDAMNHILQMGKLIAERYYDSQGAFIQLTCFPILAQDDVLGTSPMGRMAYMTGWAGHQYFWRYRYYMDREWLRETGYPVLKDLARFYTDFLTEGEDGLYHAFPSNQGEDGFTGESESYRDTPQVMLHLRFALFAALDAARALDVDHALQKLWENRIEQLAEIRTIVNPVRKAVDNWDDFTKELTDAIRNSPRIPWAKIVEGRGDLFPPEFLGFDGNIRSRDKSLPTDYANPDFCASRWYAGKMPLYWMTELRNRVFLPERDWGHVRNILEKWRTPNGLLCGMAVHMYGYPGALTETTGIIAPIQECLLESWDGTLKVFPVTPHEWGDVSFEKLRAEGAYLVSATRTSGKITHVKINSECGGDLCLSDPFSGVECKIEGAELSLRDNCWVGHLLPGQTVEMTLK